MKNQTKVLLLIVVLFFSFCLGEKSKAAGPTIVEDDIKNETHWSVEGSPYIISKTININAPLTIEPGVIVKFKNRLNIYFIINSSFSAVGTEDKKIVFTSTCDYIYGETREYCSSRWVSRDDWLGISIFDNTNKIDFKNTVISYASIGIAYQKTKDISVPSGLTIRNSEIRDCSNEGLRIGDTYPTIEYNKIHHNVHYGILFNGNANLKQILRNNSIYSNISAGLYVFNMFIPIDAKFNWWGDPSGPRYHDYYNQELSNDYGKGNQIVGRKVEIRPWLESEPSYEEIGCQENCFSNVMFLPGIKASRLYKDGSLGSEDKLWPPNYFGNDLDNLALDDDGKSINNVYTRDAIDEVAIPYVGGNIYKTFLQKLEDLKDDKTINDYESFAYDWRQNVEDVAKNGTPYEGAIKSAVADIETLSQSSKSKKVTIVAHSNGGLLAKAIMLELKTKGLEDKVDKIIIVGTPQMGTPLSILSLLYGYDESALFGTLISREDSRTLAENMPGAYGLLPSSEYFDRMENPFITFSSQQTRYKKFMDAYGEKISSNSEFKDFLLGKEGREKPDGDEVEKENILNEKLITQANEMHDRLDSWTPPEGVEVIQIAGWGLDTVSGVKYSEKEKTDCYMADSKIPSCIGIGEYEPIYEPQFTVDGDKVVVAPSALMMSEVGNVKRYWMDLRSNNKFININRKHKDLTEVESVLIFLDNIIKDKMQTSPLPEFINGARPMDFENAQPRLRMSLYSPLDIHLYDEQGNHTGPKKIMIDGHEKTVFEEGIPNSYYQQFGKRKSVGFEENQNIKVVMEGYAIGTYTLKFDEIEVSQDGEKILSSATLSNLPTTDKTTVSFEIPETGLADMTTLKADMDSDGKNEYEIDKNIGKEISLPVTFEMISQNVDHLAKLNFITSSKTQDFLQIKIKEFIHDREMIEKLEEKNNKIPKANEIRLLNKKIDDLLDFISNKLDIDMTVKAQEILIHDLKSVKM